MKSVFVLCYLNISLMLSKVAHSLFFHRLWCSSEECEQIIWILFIRMYFGEVFQLCFFSAVLQSDSWRAARCPNNPLWSKTSRSGQGHGCGRSAHAPAILFQADRCRFSERCRLCSLSLSEHLCVIGAVHKLFPSCAAASRLFSLAASGSCVAENVQRVC